MTDMNEQARQVNQLAGQGNPSERRFGFKDMLKGIENLQPTAAQADRRRIARSLQDIASHIIRMDATPDQLSSYVQEVEALALRLAQQGKVDGAELFKRMINSEATGDDVFLSQDFNILSGKASAVAFPMDMEVVGERVQGSAYVPLPFQGPPQRVHGGIVAAMFDILLARTQVISGIFGYTASLEIKYHAATPLETELQLEAWVEKIDGRKMFNAGKIMVDGKLCASARGLWIQPKVGFMG